MKIRLVDILCVFPVKETQRLQFGFEAFNLFNTPQFRAPNAQPGNPTFGRIMAAWLDNRQTQFALKYLF